MNTSALVTLELQSRGVASVIVELAPPAASAATDSIVLPALAAFRSTASEASPLNLMAAGARTIGRSRHAYPLRVPRAEATPVAPLPSTFRIYPNLGLALGVVDRDGLRSLQARRDVSQILSAPVLSLIRPIAGARLKTLTTTTTWGIEALRVPRLWAEGLTGAGVKVAHLDTGCDGDHPSLRNALEHFAYFDDFGEEQTSAPFDDDGHGTHTAATIAGRAVRGKHVGVAPAAQLLSAKVIEGGNAVARVLAGMDWAVERKAHILNMSLGFRGYVTDFLRLTQILRQRGILPVFAAGNEGPGYTRSPGNYDESLSVGAHNAKRQVAQFSSSAKFKVAGTGYRTVPDLVGPGVDVESARAGGGYQAQSGTSMATPHIAGLAALLLQAKPDATVDELENAIFRSCRRSASMSEARAGRGCADAVDALRHLTGIRLSNKRGSSK